jgi:hypothetical protein
MPMVMSISDRIYCLEAGAVVTVEGCNVVELNGGNVTVEVASSPPPHPAVSASATASATVRVIARLACMHAD